MKNNWKFWAVWGGLLFVAYLIYLQIKKTATDEGKFVQNAFIDPLKILFG